MTNPAPFTPRLPPVARGACRAIHAAPPALPESPPVPPADAPVEEVLADQAAELARAVEETDPALMQAARDAAEAEWEARAERERHPSRG